ncbi:MAG: serine protease AprX [Saprospiraceae bacterium]|jgi:serine protease AprX
MQLKNTLLLISLVLMTTISFAQDVPDYGMTKEQIEFLNLDCLHQRGFTGKGVTIAHFDDGFDGFDQLKAFEYARVNNYVKGKYDFQIDGTLKYEGNGSHGTNTLSIVHGYLPGQYIGTAYNANMLLARTEYTPTETHKEEMNWKYAVDWALENGADVITSSLQYNTFDEGEGNYDYKSDFDGNTSIIAKAADYAASKGVLVVTIQGNFGNGDWYYLATPGDADSVLTVGAAGIDGKKAGFSSFGPSADGQVKPDVMAVGFQTTIIEPNGDIRKGNGTSFAGPAIAGMVACLKQAHPLRSNMEIITAVRQSADRYGNPDILGGYGYGIPDACKADDILSKMDTDFEIQKSWIIKDNCQYKVNKCKLKLKPNSEHTGSIELYNTLEQKLSSASWPTRKIKIKKLAKGNYSFRIVDKDGKIVAVENFLKK